MDDVDKQVGELKKRVNRLENIAYILGGLAVALGLAGASLFTSLSEARSEAESLKGEMSQLRSEINEDLSTRAEVAVRENFRSTVRAWEKPWLSDPISASGGTVTKKAHFCALGSLSTFINARQTNAHCKLSLDPGTGFWTLEGRRKDGHINLACQMVCFGIEE